MKYLIILISLIATLAYGQIFEPEFPIVVNIILVLSILLTAVLLEYPNLKENLEFDFKIISQRKVIGKFDLLIAVAWTILWWFSNDNFKDIIFIIFIPWIIPLAEIIVGFIYKREKPFTLFIKEKELILNNRWTQRRNLTELKEIQFDRISKNLKLDFKTKSTILIKIREYNYEDIEKFLEVITEKSENNVFIPISLMQEINDSAVSTAYKSQKSS